MGQLPVSALEAVDPFVPGAPICKVHSDDPDFAELQIVLKGGQLSGERLFLDARDGVRVT